jgi:hypothetical protein
MTPRALEELFIRGQEFERRFLHVLAPYAVLLFLPDCNELPLFACNNEYSHSNAIVAHINMPPMNT